MKHRVACVVTQVSKQTLHHRLSHSITDFVSRICHFSSAPVVFRVMKSFLHFHKTSHVDTGHQCSVTSCTQAWAT